MKKVLSSKRYKIYRSIDQASAGLYIHVYVQIRVDLAELLFL